MFTSDKKIINVVMRVYELMMQCWQRKEFVFVRPINPIEIPFEM